MATKQFNTRVQHKIDTWENWSKAENFKPLLGEIIIYTTDENGNENVKIKIGDGNTVVHSLPFTQIQSNWAQEDSTALDYIQNKPTIPQIQFITWEDDD